MRIPTPSGDIAIDLTKSGRVRLSRQLADGNTYYMLSRLDCRAVSAGILRVLENQDQAATSVRLDQGPPLSIVRQRTGIRLERTFYKTGETEWMSMSESVACDVAAGLLDVAGLLL